MALAAAYVLAPGAPDVPLNGIPIGQTGTVTLVMLVGTWLWTRRNAKPAAFWLVILFVALIGAKAAIGWATPQTGWLARYYANENFEGSFERSIDFPGLPGTRIDRILSFRETEFPVHFFNNREYNTGVYRETTLPFSVRWTAHLVVPADETIAGVLTANGRAELVVDGDRQALITGLGQTAVGDFTLALKPGHHVIELKYQKPADTTPLLRLEHDGSIPFLRDRTTPLSWDDAEKISESAALFRRQLATAAGWLLHGIALFAVAIGLWPGIRAQRLMPLPVGPIVVGLLLAQGVWKSQHLVGHVWTMSGGDDWLNYEMSGRDVVLNGLIMSQGGVIGRGQPFSLYPGYAYFIAFAHWLTGESLAGVVLLNFVLLALATLVAYRIGRHLLGPINALGGLAWLLLIEQADFVRYYTVTLFSENLYYVLAAATVLFLVRYHSHGRTGDVIAAAIAGALASWTRPSMMLLLPLAALTILIVQWRSAGTRKAVFDVMAFGAVWIAALMPITIRNYIMSGRAVLLTAGQGASFVAYNMPVDDKSYFAGFDGTLFNSATILVRMFIDHPIISLRNYATKAGFSLGMVHWMGSGTIHPELIATSILYFASIVMIRGMRTVAAVPLHFFVLTHVATLMLTMPSNYGYRMILPAFVFMSLGAGAVVFGPAIRFFAARWPAIDRAVSEATP